MANNKFDYADNLNAFHMTDAAAMYDPARSNVYEFVVTQMDGNWLKAGIDYTEKPSADDVINDVPNILRLSVTKASVPHFKQNVIEVQRGNTKAKFAGAIEFDAGTIVVNDFVGLNTKAALMAWQRLSGDITTGAVGRKETYAKECYLVEYTPDFIPIRQWLLRGCWISEISEDDFDSENDGKRQITATIQYDRAEPQDLYDGTAKPVYNSLK